MNTSEKETMAADERRLTLIRTPGLSASISVHRRLITILSAVPDGRGSVFSDA
jgi:hypothetical protein